MIGKKRKSIAPEDHGELPNEKRCPNCWKLLTQYEDLRGVSTWQCTNCKQSFGLVAKEGE